MQRYIVNGLVKINGVEFWRIDDMESGRQGPDFLAHPAALVLADGRTAGTQASPGLVSAARVCNAMNEIMVWSVKP